MGEGEGRVSKRYSLVPFEFCSECFIYSEKEIKFLSK